MALDREADVLARPGMLEKVAALGGGWRDEPIPAPGRDGLLDAVAGS